MTDDDTGLAFAHPAARAAAVAGTDMPDRILLSDHVVTVEIGAFQSERGHRQRVRVNIVVELAQRGAGAGDDVDNILSYDVLTDAIATELAAERVNLLEALAERVAARILTAPQAARVFLRIEKLDRGPFALGVEIVRGRAATMPVPPQGTAPHPRVAYLPGHAAVADLPALVDALAASGAPLILCTGPAEMPPQASDARAQRRITLLAIEQQAWVLAACDPRLIVTATRTELDWGMAHGQISLWAPSKIVLDAVDGPADTDPAALAGWFAGQMGAVELVVIGTTQPAAPVPVPVPVRKWPLT